MILEILKLEEKAQMFPSAKNKPLVLTLFFSLLFNTEMTCKALEINGVENSLEAVVDGNKLDIIILAYHDFIANHLSQKFYEKDIEKYGKDSYPVYASNINNYNISVLKSTKYKGSFVVEFRLRLNEKYYLMFGSGGVSKYLVNPQKRTVKFLISGK